MSELSLRVDVGLLIPASVSLTIEPLPFNGAVTDMVRAIGDECR